MSCLKMKFKLNSVEKILDFNNQNQEGQGLKVIADIMSINFRKGFLKTTNQLITYHRTPTNRPSEHHPPTKCTNHRPIKIMRTRNNMTNFKWISDNK